MKRTKYIIQMAEDKNFKPVYRRVMTDGRSFYARYEKTLFNVDGRMNNIAYYDDRNDIVEAEHVKEGM